MKYIVKVLFIIFFCVYATKSFEQNRPPKDLIGVWLGENKGDTDVFNFIDSVHLKLVYSKFSSIGIELPTSTYEVKFIGDSGILKMSTPQDIEKKIIINSKFSIKILSNDSLQIKVIYDDPHFSYPNDTMILIRKRDT